MLNFLLNSRNLSVNWFLGILDFLFPIFAPSIIEENPGEAPDDHQEAYYSETLAIFSAVLIID